MGDFLKQECVLACRCFSYPNEHIIDLCELERKDFVCKSEIDCDAVTDDNKEYEKKTSRTRHTE